MWQGSIGTKQISKAQAKSVKDGQLSKLTLFKFARFLFVILKKMSTFIYHFPNENKTPWKIDKVYMQEPVCSPCNWVELRL